VAWLDLLVLGAAGTAAMRTALERGDLDEAARQGALAGPAIVERALGAADRTTRLAAIAAAPLVEDRAELLDALARAAVSPDRRTAIPAAAAARAIARELVSHDRPDDLADDDLARWRAAWAGLAMQGERWIELRVIALDTAAALDRDGIGVDLGAALGDPDPAFRAAAAATTAPEASARPEPAQRLAGAVIHDLDPEVALAAAQALCMAIDAASARPILDALGPSGLARIRALVTSDAPEVDDVARCLAADGSDASIAALRALHARTGR